MTGQGARSASARLYDVRYSRFTGVREARWRSVLSLTRSSVGRAIGLRRSAGAKVWPFLLLTAAYLPVVVVVGVPLLVPGDQSPVDLLGYPDLLFLGLPVTIAFAATTLPSLLTRERRDRVLSLYFSTALSPLEYVLAKALAALLLAAMVTTGPLVVLAVGDVIAADAPLARLRAVAGDLPAVLLAGFAVATFFAALGLLAGSLTAKRVFAVGGLLGLLLVSPVVAQLLEDVTGRVWLRVLSLTTLPVQAVAHALPGEDVSGIASARAAWTAWAVVVLASLGTVLVRYLRGPRS